MRESIKNSIMDTMADLHKIGLVDEITMRNIAALCLPDVKEYSPAQIVGLRKKNKLSQSALAVAMNVSTSTVQQWERGAKKPAGASKRLLDLIERKGIQVII
ncbi:DNA-binding protein [Desulfobulbus sp. Tol-SR]|nr:DNA-binding protein [Desulfobulbus sp. Tol-SR]